MKDIASLFKERKLPTTIKFEGWHADSGVALLFPPASIEMLTWAKKRVTQSVPSVYEEFLKSINGLFYRELSLFGVSPSLFKSNLLNRDLTEPWCITQAGADWHAEYPKADSTWLMFGSIEGRNENTGLFIDSSGDTYKIDSKKARNSGKFWELLEGVISP
jgi:hypothetical protein